jgi:hypothetical protein
MCFECLDGGRKQSVELRSVASRDPFLPTQNRCAGSAIVGAGVGLRRAYLTLLTALSYHYDVCWGATPVSGHLALLDWFGVVLARALWGVGRRRSSGRRRSLRGPCQ